MRAFGRAAILVITSVLIWAPSETAAAESESKLKLSGDLRLRYELDFNSVQGDGKTRREDRSRFRTRTRLGLTWNPTSQLSLISRVRHGNPDSQQGPHVTLWTDSGDEGSQKEFVADRLYARVRPGDLTLRLGRETLPFWQPHLLLWNTDVFIDGASLSWKDKNGISVHAGAWLLPNGEDDHAINDRSTLAAAQLAYEYDFSTGTVLNFGTGVLRIDDDSDVRNLTNDDVDYTITALDIRLRTRWRGMSVIAGADYYHNFEEGPVGDPEARANDAFVLYGLLGDVHRAGAVQVGYFLAYIEKFAVARFFAQNDWFRFGNATQTRSSDYLGHELRATYSFKKNVDLVARWYFIDTLSNNERGDRFRIDLNWRF